MVDAQHVPSSPLGGPRATNLGFRVEHRHDAHCVCPRPQDLHGAVRVGPAYDAGELVLASLVQRAQHRHELRALAFDRGH